MGDYDAVSQGRHRLRARQPSRLLTRSRWVSRQHRGSVLAPDSPLVYVQPDAAINPVTASDRSSLSHGELVGINTSLQPVGRHWARVREISELGRRRRGVPMLRDGHMRRYDIVVSVQGLTSHAWRSVLGLPRIGGYGADVIEGAIPNARASVRRHHHERDRKPTRRSPPLDAAHNSPRPIVRL